MSLSDKDPQIPPPHFFLFALLFVPFACIPRIWSYPLCRRDFITPHSTLRHGLVYTTGGPVYRYPGILGRQRTARTCFCSSSLPLHLAPYSIQHPAYTRHQTPAEVVRVFIYHQQRAAKSRNCGQCIPAFVHYSGPNTCMTTISHNRPAIPFGKSSHKVQGQD